MQKQITRKRPASIVLPRKTYERLLQRLQDLEDALELDKARRKAKGFRPYEEIRGELKKAGRL